MSAEPQECRVEGVWYMFVFFDEVPNMVYLLDRNNPRFVFAERVEKWR